MLKKIGSIVIIIALAGWWLTAFINAQLGFLEAIQTGAETPYILGYITGAGLVLIIGGIVVGLCGYALWKINEEKVTE